MEPNSDNSAHQAETAKEKEVYEDLDDFIFSESIQKTVSER